MGLINQSEMSLNVLATHLDNAGWDVESDEDSICLHSESGIGFHVVLDEKRFFVVFRTFLPVRNDFLASLDFSNDLNMTKFMGCFAIDSDNDLRISYVMSYEKSLIVAQFSRIALRFANLLEHLVAEDRENTRAFDFDKATKQQRIDSIPPSLLQ